MIESRRRQARPKRPVCQSKLQLPDKSRWRPGDLPRRRITLVSPVYFDNIPWFYDLTLSDAIRSKFPFFDGTLPEAGARGG